MWTHIVLAAVIAYLMGCFTAGFYVGKIFKRIDIREHGSGNAGSTNVVRTLGWKYGLLTLAIDTLKGTLAVLIGRLLAGDAGGMIAGAMVVIGHNWPVFLRFRGGKGAATTLGVAIMVDPLISLYAVLIFAAVVAIWRYVSLGAMIAAIAYAVLLMTTHTEKLVSILFISFLCILLFFQHRTNIKRLFQGKERKLSFKRRKDAKSDAV